MASLNRVVLIGNLTRDPEIRSTPDGTSVANLGIAVNRPWTNKQGERTTDFFNIVAWRKLAELCGQYLSKGSPVAIEGRLQSRSWETAEGQKRSTVEIVADNVQFLSRGPGASNSFVETSENVAEEEQAPKQQEAADDAQPVSVDSSDELPDDDIPF